MNGLDCHNGWCSFTFILHPREYKSVFEQKDWVQFPWVDEMTVDDHYYKQMRKSF